MADVNVSIALAGITAIETELAKIRGEIEVLAKTSAATSTQMGKVGDELGQLGKTSAATATQIGKAGDELDQLGKTSTTVTGKVGKAGDELGQLGKTSAATTGQISKVGGELNQLGKTSAETASTKLNQLAGNLATLGTKLSIMSVPIAALGTSIIKSGADFEAAMNKISVATGATAQDMEKVEEAAIRIGDTTTFSAGEAADAMINLGKNGITLKEQFGGVLDATVDLAAATGTSLAGAADIAAKAMQQFGADASQLPTMMNQMFNATQASTFSLDDMALALAQGGGAAATAGLSFGEFNTAMVTVSNNVASGSDAGTAFKSMLIALLAPTKEAAELQKTLGINIKDAHGNIIPMRDIVQQLTTALQGQGGAQKLATAATLAGSDAQRGITALVKGGVAEWDRNTAAVEKSGTAHAAAKKMMEGFWGAIDKLTGALEKVGIALLHSGFIPFLTDMIEGLAKAIDWVTRLDPVLLNVGAALASAVVAGGPLLLLFAGLLKTIALLTPAVTVLTGSVISLTGALKLLGTAANALPLARVASLLTFLYDKVEEGSARLVESTKRHIAEVPENVIQSMTYVAKAVEDGGNKIKPALAAGVGQPIKDAATTFEEQSNKIASKYKEMADRIADNESLGLDEKMAAFAKLGIELTKMGEVGVEAANDLREAIKKVAAETASTQLGKIINDVTLSYGDQLLAVEALIPEYEKLGKFGADGLKKIKDEAAKLQSEMATHIKDADWGLDVKMLAFKNLEASMVTTGNTGVKAMDELKETIKDTVTEAANERLKRITDDLSLSLQKQIVKVGESRDEWKDYGKDASDANKAATKTFSDLNKEVASSNIDRVLDDTTLSIEDQIAELEGMARGYDNMGEAGRAAAAMARAEMDQLNVANEKATSVLYGVETALQNNVTAWGGWGESANRIVSDFSATSEATLSEFFMTGQFNVQEFGLAVQQTFADEAAKAVVSFASEGIKWIVDFAARGIEAIIEWGTQMFAQMVLSSTGMDVATVSALLLDAALAPILIVVIALAAAIGIFLLLGGDMGDLLAWISELATWLGHILLDVLLYPINLLITGFRALIDLLSVFVGWIGTIGDALGKGDLKDLFSMFEGFNPLKGIGDFFGGLFGGIFHEGGLIPGKGDIAIRAEGGEFVMSKGATDMFGPLLSALNARGLGKSVDMAATMAGDVARADPFKAFGAGGDMMLTRPTLLLGGESGPEVVSFRHGQRGGNDQAIVNNGILVADRLTLNQLGKKLYRNAQRDQLRTRKR